MISAAALKDHLMTALATAALLGGGGMLVTHEVDLGRHDERIERIEALDDSIDGLTKELASTREQLVRVEAETGVAK